MKRIKHLDTIILWWDGPYQLEDMKEFKINNGNGLYLFVGRGRRDDSDQVKYCGITERAYHQRMREHYKLEDIRQECKVNDVSIWCGTIEFPRRFKREDLERAEKMIVRFLRPAYNHQKIKSLPNPTCLVSRWYTKEGTPRQKRISFLKTFPDVMWYDGEDWKTGNLKFTTAPTGD